MSIECTLLIGTTAVGKSSFVYENLASAPIHLIAADSMQIYRHFDIATATPSEEDLELFPHTGVNEIDPDESYNVSEFLKIADAACVRAREEDRHPLIVGGTPLYLRAFLYGLDEMPGKNPDFRRTMRQLAGEKSSGFLHERLRAVDAPAAENIHPNDTRRIIRALEIYHETGQTKTKLTSEDSLRDRFDPTVLGLRRPREEMEERITGRIEKMLDEGLIREVKQLRENWDLSRTLKQAIGFRSVSKYLDDTITKREVPEQIAERTWSLLRKQESWFRRFPVDEWYHPEHQKEELIDTLGNRFH